jgi:hypothetical protein
MARVLRLLGEVHPGQLAPVKLIEWKAIKRRGKPARFLTDRAWVGGSINALPDLNLLARACRDGCRLLASLDRENAAGASPKRRRGRPRSSDLAEDKRIANLWNSERFKTYEALANSEGKSKAEIKRALDRHRQRKPKPGGSG